MNNFESIFDTSMISNATKIYKLKEIYTKKQNQLKELSIQISKNKNSVTKTKKQIKEIENTETRINRFIISFDNEIAHQAVLIISRYDEKFADLMEYKDLVIEACTFTKTILDAINHVISLKSYDNNFDPDSFEINNLDVILMNYRRFLHNIKKLISDTIDVNLQMMINNTIEQLDKVIYIQNQIICLYQQISQLHGYFIIEYDNINNQIQDRIDNEWEINL